MVSHHHCCAGIIPARAGFTPPACVTPHFYADHPRSRGVYSVLAEESFSALGSSPLARGLRPSGQAARALALDHPRSRGVYWVMICAICWVEGSSPLARGLRSYPTPPHSPAPDHPRSRGVYSMRSPRLMRLAGSSPLARGLRARWGMPGATHGIIPARAGFTRHIQPHRRLEGDHPRSRGVYLVQENQNGAGQGSSPLARGLRRRRQGAVPAPGIIPARAGFTSARVVRQLALRDHPRSRGVYLV